MAPVAAPPIPAAADKLPKLKVPAGFKVEIYQSGVLDARGLRRGDKGTIFVSSLFVAGKIYAITGKDGKRELKTILSDLELPSGIEFRKGALYVATPKKIMRYDNIEDNLDKPPQPTVIYDKLPGDVPHGWKFLRFGPDDKLYVADRRAVQHLRSWRKYAQIFRINADGSSPEVIARGVRNTVGFDFHPKTKELWFTDNQRDWLAEDFPLDELNRLKNPGKEHFGYPYCHSGNDARSRVRLGQVVRRLREAGGIARARISAPLGMRFYTGKMFPAKYRGAIFIARHGPWNRTTKYADVVGGLSRQQQPGHQGRAVPDGLGQGQPVPRPAGRPADVA